MEWHNGLASSHEEHRTGSVACKCPEFTCKALSCCATWRGYKHNALIRGRGFGFTSHGRLLALSSIRTWNYLITNVFWLHIIIIVCDAWVWLWSSELTTANHMIAYQAPAGIRCDLQWLYATWSDQANGFQELKTGMRWARDGEADSLFTQKLVSTKRNSNGIV